MSNENENKKVEKSSLNAVGIRISKANATIAAGDMRDEKLVDKANKLMQSAEKLAIYAASAKDRADKVAKKLSEKIAKKVAARSKLDAAIKLLENPEPAKTVKK